MMARDESFGFDPEDLDRAVRAAGEQLRGVLGQFGLFGGGGGAGGAGQRPGWPGPSGDSGRRARTVPEPETTGETGDGVWVIYAVDGDGGAQVEQVYASELDALRANKHNTDSSRRVRFLPYGIPVSVLDGPEEASTD